MGGHAREEHRRSGALSALSICDRFEPIGVRPFFLALCARYYGVAEEGVPFRDIAGVIGRPLRLVRTFRHDRQPGLDRPRYFET